MSCIQSSEATIISYVYQFKQNVNNEIFVRIDFNQIRYYAWNVCDLQMHFQQFVNVMDRKCNER
jgi:hypothetical protein